ncbi:MAG: 4Fe-4S dicluster domain-containing protein [Acidimicrobiia bacterium]
MPSAIICADGWSGRPLEVEGVEVTLVEGLCLSPRSMVDLVEADEEELVLAIHRNQANLGEVQSVLRRLGFDPLAVGVLDLASVGDPAQLPMALAGATARARAYPGARPEQVKLLPADRRTRRGFLSLGTPTYSGAPRIEAELCVASRGCQICVSQCPAGALTWSDGSVSYDPNACIACGICVTACPRSAVMNPVVTPEAVAAEIGEAVRAGAFGIRYRCRDAIVAGEPGWYQVEVPCTGMLTMGWLLAPLVLGAASVDAIPCSEGGCGLGNDEKLADTFADAGVVMDRLGLESSDVASDQVIDFPPTALFSSGSTGRLLSLLATTPTTLDFVSADVGTVVIDPETCTVCLMCSQVCPTGALVGHQSDEGVSLDMDPRLCVACGQCVAQCPEVERDAIVMVRSFDSEDRDRGRREVRRDATPRCEVCGGPVAPEALLARISSMLGDDHASTIDLIGRRCVDCRGR